jgi:hypothetical protein
MIQREIESTDRGIDALVYELSPSGMIWEWIDPVVNENLFEKKKETLDCGTRK